MYNYGFLQRQKFDELQSKFKSYGVEVQPSYLRYEAQLQNGVNHYPFAFEPSATDSATEKKLNKNDAFYITGIGLFWIATGTVGTGDTAVVVNKATAPLHTFASNVDGSASLEAVYNGFFRLTTGSKVNIENLSNQNFKYVPQRINAGGTAIATPQFQLEKALFGSIADIMLAGTKSHQLSVDIPAVPTTVPLVPTSIQDNGVAMATPTVSLVLMFHGFLMKNAAIIDQVKNM